MPRVDLQVPFPEKEQAKRLGARWDGKQKTWYVPAGVDSGLFKQWLPSSQTPNVRAPAWNLANASRACWRCGAHSRVSAIMLPAAYEALIVDDEPVADRWVRGECSVLLSYISHVSELVAAHLHRLAPHYRIDHSQMTNSSYWMNHCEYCDANLGDFETIEEPGAFYQLDAGFDVCELIVEHSRRIAEPFSGSCGGCIEVE
jgi:hypothetical protein